VTRLRTGIIGLGEVAQVVHLPVLESMPDRFEVIAGCDISPTLLKVLGDRYGIAKRYADPLAMIESEELDCVLVLNSDEYHAECTIAALERGQHVLVEKPMCLSPREAQAVIDARDRADRVVIVGYMRRFAPAFAAAKEQVGRLGPLNYVRVHDIIGRNQLLIDQTTRVERPGDVPAERMAERWARGGELVRDAIGDVPQDVANTYRLLCGLGSHDLSALRELVGRPRGVAAARQWRNGLFIAALLEYDGFYAAYETGVDEQLRFDAHLELYGERATTRVQYDTPYVRHLPTLVITEESEGDELRRTVVRPNFKDPYTYELEHFHQAITSGVAPKTTPEDFAEDLDLFVDIVRAVQSPA
jgi:predicted dehydrogenase